MSLCFLCAKTLYSRFAVLASEVYVWGSLIDALCLLVLSRKSKMYREQYLERMCYVLHVCFVLVLGRTSLLCIDKEATLPRRRSFWPIYNHGHQNRFWFSFICRRQITCAHMCMQVFWHPVSISVQGSCDSCVSEVADPLTETVCTLNISTPKPFGYWTSLSWRNYFTITSA